MEPKFDCELSQGPSKRSKRGCITCRIRRVKCDETRPACIRCQQSKRTCDGYLAGPDQRSRRDLAAAVRDLSVVGPASRALSRPPSHSPEDASYYDFFRLRTAMSTNQLFPSEFWSRLLLAAAEREPALWRAAVALGALHRGYENRHGEKHFRDFASRHYVVAIGQAREIREPKALLVASVAFAALAGLAGRFADSQVHVKSGLLLTCQLLRDRKAEDPQDIGDADLDMIIESLSRLDLQDMSFVDASAPYTPVHYDHRIPKLHAFGEAEDLRSAARDVLGLLRGLLSVWEGFQTGQVPEHKFKRLRGRLFDGLYHWEEEMLILMRQGDVGDAKRMSKGRPRTTPRLLAIKVYHALLLVFWSSSDLYGPATDSEQGGRETKWDACLPHFERIVALSSELEKWKAAVQPGFSMSLEPGIAMPLLFTATRCRHPIVRRRALRLLRDSNTQEGVWNSAAAAVVAERWISLEEGNIDLDLPLYSDHPAFSAQLVDVMQEKPEAWLGRDVQFLCVSNWKEWPLVPEFNRIVYDDLSADLDANSVNIVFWGRDKDTKKMKIRHEAVLSF